MFAYSINIDPEKLKEAAKKNKSKKKGGKKSKKPSQAKTKDTPS